jgi:lipoprotein-releasing system permease protein
MWELWLGRRLLGLRGGTMGATAVLSLIGLVIGVASLIVAMAVVSGYQSTLQKSVIDVVGHLLVMKRGSTLTRDTFDRDIRPLAPEIVAATPFLYVEAVVAHAGQISGVVIEGVDPVGVHTVLNLKNHLQDGQLDFSGAEHATSLAWIGKGLAKKYKLAVGDHFKVVLPVNSDFDSSTFRPRLAEFQVRGVLNLGRQDFDSRYVMTDLKSAQELANVGDKVSGFRIRLQAAAQAPAVVNRIVNQFGYQYMARDWEEVNHNLFEAARLEKVVIFLVLMVLIIASAFNVSSTLFVGVIRRYHDISLLKALGATGQSIQRIFLLQGVGLGVLGSGLGIMLGLILCGLFMWAETRFGLIPAEVYKLDRIDVELRWTDFVAIVGVCLTICLIFSWAPARRGAKLSPMEGLRYE